MSLIWSSYQNDLLKERNSILQGSTDQPVLEPTEMNFITGRTVNQDDSFGKFSTRVGLTRAGSESEPRTRIWDIQRLRNKVKIPNLGHAFRLGHGFGDACPPNSIWNSQYLTKFRCSFFRVVRKFRTLKLPKSTKIWNLWNNRANRKSPTGKAVRRSLSSIFNHYNL